MGGLLSVSGTGNNYILGNVGIGNSSPSQTLSIQGSGATDIFNVASSSGTSDMIIKSNGNVGIGTTSPAQKLQVGSNSAGGNVLIANGWLCVGAGASSGNGSCASASASTTAAGTIFANNLSIVQGDYAERYPSLDSGIQPGMLVAADAQNSGYVIRATSTVAAMGVVSTAPGIVIGDTGTNASSTTYAVALSGRVPVRVTNENGNIKIGDYITVSAQFEGYGMKATVTGQVLGRALENFTSSTTGDSDVILVFVQPTYYQPQVANLVQNASNTGDSGVQAWLSGLANLNMTNASVFGDIAVTGSLAVQNDLHVGGIIYAATLNVDTVNAKKLCLGQTCVTEDQLKDLLKLLNQQNGIVAGVSSPTPTTVVTPPAADPTATNPAPVEATPPAVDPSVPPTPVVPDAVAPPAVDNPPVVTPPAVDPATTVSAPPATPAPVTIPAPTVSDAATPPPATGN